jgi:hypothetical protein
LDTLDRWKTQTKIASSKSAEEIKYLIDRFLRDRQNMFNYPKPAEFHTGAENEKSEEESTGSSKLKPILPLS